MKKQFMEAQGDTIGIGPWDDEEGFLAIEFDDGDEDRGYSCILMGREEFLDFKKIINSIDPTDIIETEQD